MNIDIKGVNSVLLIVIIVLVLYCLLRKELFTTSVAVPSTICKNSNENNTYHPNGNNNEFNPDNCMYVGGDKSSCKVDGAPLASNSGDDNLATDANELEYTNKFSYWMGLSNFNPINTNEIIKEIEKEIKEARTEDEKQLALNKKYEFSLNLLNKMCSNRINFETNEKYACDITNNGNNNITFNDLLSITNDMDAETNQKTINNMLQFDIMNENMSAKSNFDNFYSNCDSYCNLFNNE